MEAREALSKMVIPSQKRPCWLGGICQIHITRACDMACLHCSQGSDLAGKVVFMSPDEFETAVKSLGFGVAGQESFFGVVGMFGGNCALSPHFEDYCEILRALVPLRQRGIWVNHPHGKAKIMRITFWPQHSNLNCHMSEAAYTEFSADWPESVPFLKGMDRDSVHGSPWVSMVDLGIPEDQRWDMIAYCDVNQFWSSLIGVIPGRGLRAYLCELMFAQANLHAVASDAADWPDSGIVPYPGWWKAPIEAFESQVMLHCHHCSVPMRMTGKAALGDDPIEFSATHATIAKPKRLPRKIDLITIPQLARPERPATEYLEGVTPGYMRS